MTSAFRRLQEKRRDGEAGFTLIELLVVIIIIGILAAIAIPVFLQQRKKAYVASAESDLRNTVTAQEAYFTDSNVYAPSGSRIWLSTTYGAKLNEDNILVITSAGADSWVGNVANTNEDQRTCSWNAPTHPNAIFCTGQ
mgnify:CR=1 FL=1